MSERRCATDGKAGGCPHRLRVGQAVGGKVRPQTLLQQFAGLLWGQLELEGLIVIFSGFGAELAVGGEDMVVLADDAAE